MQKKNANAKHIKQKRPLAARQLGCTKKALSLPFLPAKDTHNPPPPPLPESIPNEDPYGTSRAATSTSRPFGRIERRFGSRDRGLRISIWGTEQVLVMPYRDFAFEGSER